MNYVSRDGERRLERCGFCDEPIYEGEEFVSLGRRYHKWCLYDFDPLELLRLIGRFYGPDCASAEMLVGHLGVSSRELLEAVEIDTLVEEE